MSMPVFWFLSGLEVCHSRSSLIPPSIHAKQNNYSSVLAKIISDSSPFSDRDVERHDEQSGPVCFICGISPVQMDAPPLNAVKINAHDIVCAHARC